MQRFLLIATALACGTLQAATLQDKGFKLSETEQKLLDLTNAERKKEKLSPYQPNSILFDVARSHAANMAKQGKMEHDLDGKSPYDRIKGAGYKYFFAGENIARGRHTLPEIVEGWMNSPGHKENILDKDYIEIGIGAATAASGETYYAQVFGKPRK